MFLLFLCPTLCNPMDCSTQASLSFTISQSLCQLMSTESVMPSSHLILCCLLLLLPTIFPSIRVFSNESALPIRWPKYWSFSFSISNSNEYSGLISFRMDSWISLKSRGLSRVFSTTIWKHQFFGAQPSLWFNSHICMYMTTGKTIASTIWTFVANWYLLFKTLSRFVIAFFLRSKHLLILWLQSLSALILEPKKMESDTFHFFPISLPWSDRTGCHDISFLNVEC